MSHNFDTFSFIGLNIAYDSMLDITIVGNLTNRSIQCAVTDIRSACHSFFLAFPCTFLPNLCVFHCVILCHPYLGGIDCASQQAFPPNSLFLDAGTLLLCREWSDLRRTCSTLFPIPMLHLSCPLSDHWCGLVHQMRLWPLPPPPTPSSSQTVPSVPSVPSNPRPLLSAGDILSLRLRR